MVSDVKFTDSNLFRNELALQKYIQINVIDEELQKKNIVFLIFEENMPAFR